MKYQIDTLSNGLRVVTAPMEGAQSVTVQITVGVGSRYEDPAVNGGVSHFLEHLLFKGTRARPSTKIISEQIDAVGGWSNAYTANDVTSFYAKVPGQHAFLALDILCDMMRNSLFDAAEIDRERQVIIEEMNVYRDDPASFVHRLVPKLLWPNHPLSADVIGEEGVIKSIGRPAILAHHTEYYKAKNMVICFAGKIDRAQALQAADKLMGDMGSGLVKPAPEATNDLAEQKAEVVEKDTAQTHLIIGSKAYPYLDAHTAAARVIATILGRGLSSRLFLNVRELKGLAYTINSNMENFVDTGQFSIYAGVNTSKSSQAIVAILEELQEIISHKVGEEELHKAKNQLIGGIQMAMESNLSVADRLSSQLVLLGKVKPLEESIEEINKVTAAEVQSVSADMLRPSSLRMGIITPDANAAVKTFEELASS